MKQTFSIQSSFPLLVIAVLLGCSMPSDGADSSKADTKAAELSERPTENRLSRETSPYLLLHAHNPVDWYPWGPEAFEKAKQEDKPIFLSVGYSSCYWCHVMERLVFSNPKIAAVMNEHFVNIKVDREERPDVDDIYMTALQIYFQITGSPQTGGWPLSMFLTPQGKPFAGGTYFPPEDGEGQTGFGTVLARVLLLWDEQRSAIDSNAELLTEQVRLSMRPRLSLERPELERQLVLDTIDALKKSYDPEYGGIDFDANQPDSPKFPVPAKLELLQYAAANYSDKQAREILDHTLRKLAAGGIRDHLAGGFHRYSTDRAWRVPHFEKMLYDNAQLAAVYVEGYRQTGDERFRDVTSEIFDFILREMTDAQGGFHSALDAETDAIEGKYYVWTPEEIETVLGVDEAEVFNQTYGLNLPEFFDHGYVLHLPSPLDDIATEFDITLADLQVRLRSMRDQLLSVRNERQSPLKDDKILTSWNGLMISALARGGAAFDEPRYVDAASKAADFILSHMRDADGRLLRTYRVNTAKLNAYVDDYAFFIQGLLDLHEATDEQKWLDEAHGLAMDQIDLFWDESGTGFFFTSRHHEELLARTKNAYDSVIPSGNGASARNLIRLSELKQDPQLLNRSREILELFTPAVVRSPRSMTQMALAMGEYLSAQTKAPGQPQSQAKPKKPSDLIILAAAESTDPKDPKNKNQRIHPKVYLSVDRLPAGNSCDVMFVIDIVEGWHINTNPAKPDFASPTEIVVKSKYGTKLAKVVFPAGKKLQLEGIDEPFHVYEKQLAVRGQLAIPKTAAGKSEEIGIVVKYQACNDSQCERPTEISLSGKIPVAAVGAPVKLINQKLFNPPKKRAEKIQR